MRFNTLSMSLIRVCITKRHLIQYYYWLQVIEASPAVSPLLLLEDCHKEAALKENSLLSVPRQKRE
jgi:hypothetical protein